jgi:hypothetical protein
MASHAEAEKGRMERNCPPEACARLFDKVTTCSQGHAVCRTMSAGGPASNAKSCDERLQACLAGVNQGCWLGRAARRFKCGLAAR